MRELERKFYNLNYPTAFTSTSNLQRELDIPKEDVKNWADTQPIITKFKPVITKFKRRPLLCHDDLELSMDLADMRAYSRHNRNYKYIAVLVSCLSRKLYAFPLKNKTSAHVAEAMRKLLRKIEKPRIIFSDAGGEMRGAFDDLLRQQGIEHWTSRNEPKAMQAERAIRTLKSRLFKYLEHKATKRWYDVLQKIVDGINATYNRSIGMRPNDVDSNEKLKQIFIKNYKDRIGFPMEKGGFVVGGKVRLSKIKAPFEKRYFQGYTDNVFTVEKKHHAENQPIYTVRDADGELITGKVYTKQMVKDASVR
jgi:hypothetical protein